jgi:HlyD family secretion protein
MHRGIKGNKLSRKKIITLSIVGIVIIAIVTGTVIVAKNYASKSSSASVQRTAKASKQNIEVSITGSGTVTSANTSDLMSNVAGKITKAYVSEGDTVKKGDLLYEIDDTDAQLNIEKIENSISQAELSASNSEKGYNNLTITAPFSGKVTNVTAEKGESVNNGMSLFTITQTSKLILSVPFSTTYISNIKVGQKAQVYVQELMDTVEGTVTAIGDNAYTASNGGTVKNVEVTVSNPGSLTDSMTASVDISTSSGLESGSQVCTFAYANKKTVTAATSGVFSSVNIKDNDYVNKGDVLIKIENDDLQVTSKTNSLKMQDLENQLTAAEKTLEDYKVYAPFDGTISAVTAKQGDSLERGGALLSIRDFNQMEFTISVDELDISKVEVGQEVSVTVDALTDTETTPLSGEVVYKAMEGTSSNGVATYNVTIKINETKNLLAGMNANATIILNKAEDALAVPLEAVTKRGDKSYVWVKGSSGTSTQQAGVSENSSGNRTPSDNSDVTQSGGTGSNTQRKNTDSSTSGKMPTNFTQNKEYYANATMKEVETGLTNESYIEIKSGLSEGDEVILPPLVEASNGKSSNSTSSGFSMGGVTGGMSGGMSGGMGGPPDMQSGGNNNSNRKSN